MLQDRYETDKLFNRILQLTYEMDPVLAQIDQLLEDEALYQLIRSDLAKRFPRTEQTGRNSTPVEVVLRMLAVKRLYRLSFEQTEHQVRDSLVLRQFCRVYLNEVPDDTTLIRWAALIQPGTLEQFNQRLTELATQLKVTKGRKLRTDGTVVETNIHPPSDSSLLGDSVRVLGRSLSRAKQVLGEQAGLGKEVFRNRIRSVRRLARQVGEAMRKGSETAKIEGMVAYRKLVKAAQVTIQQVRQVLPELQESTVQEAEKLAEILETFLPRAEQVVDQTVRRVFQQEKVPAPEKIVSLFEPHTDIIRRNKAHKPTEYGHKVWLDEVDGGIVTRWEVLAGNPSDDQQWAASLEHHQKLFGRPPDQASGDRGVHSPNNERIAKEKGVKRVILPQPGKKSEVRKQQERQPWFVRGRKWHVGIEGRISVLKRRFGLHRCWDHGKTGFEKWVGWGVIAANLRVIGQKVTTKA
ncbi:MAG TPA: ISNCY family transposase [Anaerolineales bacterium]|jgi:IS5 family transposase|nr:ISNCY family transposase [Anaerolineales bacterium]